MLVVDPGNSLWVGEQVALRPRHMLGGWTPGAPTMRSCQTRADCGGGYSGQWTEDREPGAGSGIGVEGARVGLGLRV